MFKRKSKIYASVKPGIICITLSLVFNLAKAQDTAKKISPVIVNGSTALQGIGYSTTRPVPTRVPFSYILSGDLTVSIANNIVLPFSFVVSEQERHLSQPFNQFGISPQYKWLKIHLGYRNLAFSHYTLNGYTFFGAGIEINTTSFRFAAIGGRFDRALTGVAAVDTVNKPIYRRMGYGIKLGYGSADEYFDFIAFTAQDQYNSLQAIDTSKGHPSENLVAGVVTRSKIVTNLYFEGNYAYSLYTDNARTLPLSEVAGSNYPKIPSLGSLFTVRVNTLFFSAMDGALVYNLKSFGVKLNYTYIDPGYMTMGSYSVTSDVQNLTINPFFRLWKGKINASGSIGYQRDNLTDKKAATSERLIGSASINIDPVAAYGLSFQYNNYTTSQAPGLKVINDTIRLAQVSSSFSILPHYTLQSRKFIHSWIATYMRQTLVDHNDFTRSTAQYQTSNANLIYNLNVIRNGFGFNISFNNSHTVTYYGANDYNGFTVGASKSFFKSRFSNSLNFTFNETRFNGLGSGNVVNVRLTEIYRLKRHSLNLTVFQIYNHSTQAGRPSFKETIATLGYYFNF